MIFSGRISHRSCQRCEVEVYRVYPTSLLFLLILGIVGTFLSLGPALGVFGQHRWLFPLLLIANIVIVVLIFAAIDGILGMLFPLPDRCSTCGSKMDVGGGFYDFALVPTFSEMLGTVIHVGLLLVLRWSVM